jgi:hypothetical protein
MFFLFSSRILGHRFISFIKITLLLGERVKTLGYYTHKESKSGYSGIDVYNTLKKSLRDFEREKYELIKPPYVKFTYWCPRCLWFVIDYTNDYGIDSNCGNCNSRLQYANKKFIRHTSKLLEKYITRVKPILNELHRILGYFRDYVINDYSTLYLEIDNENIGLMDIWIYPHRLNAKFTMYMHIVVYKLNQDRLDIVDKLENLINEYGLNGYIWIMSIPIKLESLAEKGYRESIAFNSYNYSKNVISKYLI